HDHQERPPAGGPATRGREGEGGRPRRRHAADQSRTDRHADRHAASRQLHLHLQRAGSLRTWDAHARQGAMTVHLDPLVLIGVSLTAIVYWRGARSLRGMMWRGGAFFAGLVAILFAPVSALAAVRGARFCAALL